MVSISRLQSTRNRVDELDYRFNWPEGLLWASIGSLPGTVIAVIASVATTQTVLAIVSLALLFAVVLFGIFAFVMRRQMVESVVSTKRHVCEDLDAIITLHEASRQPKES